MTHHSNMEVLKYVPENDIKKNATVIAAIVYQLAMRPTRL